MDTKAIKEGLARRFAQCQALWEGFKKDSAPRAAAFARGLALRFRPAPKVTNEELLSRLAGLAVKIDALSQKVDAVEAKQAALVKTAQDLPPLAVSAILTKLKMARKENEVFSLHAAYNALCGLFTYRSIARRGHNVNYRAYWTWVHPLLRSLGEVDARQKSFVQEVEKPEAVKLIYSNRCTTQKTMALILGMLLSSPEIFQRARLLPLVPKDFDHEVYQYIYQRMLTIANQGQPINFTILREDIENDMKGYFFLDEARAGLDAISILLPEPGTASLGAVTTQLSKLKPASFSPNLSTIWRPVSKNDIINSEAFLLAGLFQAPDKISVTKHLLITPKDFSGREFGMIYDAMLTLVEAGKPISAEDAIADELKRQGTFEDIGGTLMLRELQRPPMGIALKDTDGLINVKKYARKIRKFCYQRNKQPEKQSA